MYDADKSMNVKWSVHCYVTGSTWADSNFLLASESKKFHDSFETIVYLFFWYQKDNEFIRFWLIFQWEFVIHESYVRDLKR